MGLEYTQTLFYQDGFIRTKGYMKSIGVRLGSLFALMLLCVNVYAQTPPSTIVPDVVRA